MACSEFGEVQCDEVGVLSEVSPSEGSGEWVRVGDKDTAGDLPVALLAS